MDPFQTVCMREGYPHPQTPNLLGPVKAQVRGLSVPCGSLGVMRTSATDQQVTGDATAQEIASLEAFWCSDCRAGEMFERLGDSTTGADWVCTACGAGYFDALDRVLAHDGGDHVMAGASTGTAGVA